MRLQNSPPTQDPCHNARITLLAWIRRSAVNYLTDVGRRASWRTSGLCPEELDRLEGNPGGLSQHMMSAHGCAAQIS